MQFVSRLLCRPLKAYQVWLLQNPPAGFRYPTNSRFSCEHRIDAVGGGVPCHAPIRELSLVKLHVGEDSRSRFIELGSIPLTTGLACRALKERAGGGHGPEPEMDRRFYLHLDGSMWPRRPTCSRTASSAGR